MWLTHRPFHNISLILAHRFVEPYQAPKRPNVDSCSNFNLGQLRELIEDDLWCPNLQRGVQLLRHFAAKECCENSALSDAVETTIRTLSEINYLYTQVTSVHTFRQVPGVNKVFRERFGLM